MVAPVFRARIRPGKEREFERFVMGTGLALVTAQAGCSHATVGKSRWSDQPEFIVVTHWDSIDAPESLAGEDWRQAVVEPEEEHMLTEVFCEPLRGDRERLTPRAADQVCEDAQTQEPAGCQLRAAGGCRRSSGSVRDWARRRGCPG
jgi:hypothetical protein